VGTGAVCKTAPVPTREQVAVQKDEDIKAKMQDLRDHLNGPTEKPQFLHDKLSRLGEEQLITYRERIAHGEIVRQRQRELTDAQTRLSVAQMDLQASDKDVREIDAQIQEVKAIGCEAPPRRRDSHAHSG